MKRWRRFFALAALPAVLCGGAVAASIRWFSVDAGQADLIRAAIERSLGARIAFGGPVDIALFPRPQMTAADVRLTAADGALAVSMPSVRATFAIGPLFGGRFVLDKVQLQDPTGVVDLDGLAFSQQHGRGTPRDGDPTGALPDKLTIAAGLIQVRSSNPVESGLLTDLHTVVDNLQSGSTAMSGGASWHGEHGDFSAQVDGFAPLLRGEPVSGYAKLRSPSVTVALTGTLAKGFEGGFNGSVTATAPSLSALLRALGAPTRANGGVQHVSFTGTAESGDTGIAFGDAKLLLNDTALEGTLAWQSGNGRPGLIGTLATDLLDLHPLAAALPRMTGPDGSWNRQDLDLSFLGLHDFDLRVSASRVKLDTIEATDAALSVFCHEGRMEVSLGEAQAYGGLVKARFLASGSGSATEIKGDASWSRLDLDEMAEPFHIDRGRVRGIATGHVAIEGHGASVAAMVASAGGRGHVDLRQANLAALPLFDALLRTDSGGHGATRPIDIASADFHMADGQLTLDDATATGPDLHVTVTGHVSLPERSYLLTSVPLATSEGDPRPASSVRVWGHWGGPVRTLDIEQRGGTPAQTFGSTTDSFYP